MRRIEGTILSSIKLSTVPSIPPYAQIVSPYNLTYVKAKLNRYLRRAKIDKGWVLNRRRQAFMPELELAAGIGLDGDVAFNQAAGKVGAFRAGLADAA